MKLKINTVWKSVKDFTSKNTPEILNGFGVVGMLTAIGLGIAATPKALQHIEMKRAELDKEDLSKKEMAEAVWKDYIPTAATAVVSTACIIGSSAVNHNRNAALATAYALSETALKEYKDKVIETIGEKKEAEIQDAVYQDKAKKTSPTGTPVMHTEGEEVERFFEPCTGRYFWSTVAKVEAARANIATDMADGSYAYLNDWSYFLGLEETEVTGETLGWMDPIKFRLIPGQTPDGELCRIIRYIVPPKYIR